MNQRSTERQRLPKRVIQLGWVSFFADICSELVYPILPLFLVGALRLPPALVGVIEGCAEATVSIMKGLSGYWIDLGKSRLTMVRWGYGLSAISKPLIGLAFGWPVVLFARVLDRFGKGIRTTPRDTLLSESVPPEILGKALGFHRSMDTAGALVGVLAGLGLLFLLPGDYRLMFFLAGLPGIISVLFLRKVTDVNAPLKSGEKIAFKRLFHSVGRGYWIALAASLFFAAANTSDAFLLMRAKELGLTDVEVIGAYACYNVVYMLFSLPLGSLSDKVGRWKVVLPGWLLYGAVYLAFSAMTRTNLWAIFAAYGLAIGATKATGVALILEHSPGDLKGSSLGFYYFVTGIITLLANGLVGLVYQRLGAGVSFILCGVFAFVGVMIALILLLGKTRLKPVAQA